MNKDFLGTIYTYHVLHTFSKVSTPENVFKSLHTEKRFQTFAVTVYVFAGDM